MLKIPSDKNIGDINGKISSEKNIVNIDDKIPLDKNMEDTEDGDCGSAKVFSVTPNFGKETDI